MSGHMMAMSDAEVAAMAQDIAAELDAGTKFPAAGQTAGHRDMPLLPRKWPPRAPTHESQVSLGPCFYCGEPAHTRDHILPRARGSMEKVPGTRQTRNLRPACAACNVWRAIAGHCHVALALARGVGFDLGLEPPQVMRLWGWMGDMPQRRECRRLGLNDAQTEAVQRLHPPARITEG